MIVIVLLVAVVEVALAQGGDAAKEQHAVIGVAQTNAPAEFPRIPPDDGFPRRAWACSSIGDFPPWMATMSFPGE